MGLRGSRLYIFKGERTMWKSCGTLTLIILLACMSLNGCVGLKTFPQTARAGDTITIGIGLGYFHGGDTDLMSKYTTQVIISDGGSVNYQLTNDDVGNGYVRSVFNLFPDSRSNVSNYNMWTKTATIAGRPFETVVVVDLPPNIPNGIYTVETISTDGVAGWKKRFISNLEISGQGGSPSDFLDEWGLNWGLQELENCGFGLVRFSPSSTPTPVGGVELSINFDDTLAQASGIQVVQPQINMGNTRNLYWSAAGGTVHVYILSPQGVVNTDFLKFYILIPPGTPYPNFVPSVTKVVDLDGNNIPGVTVQIAEDGIFPN